VSGSHSIDIEVAPDAVWEQLVAPARREWYYRLTPEGDFAAGTHIRWLDVRGDLVEESDVVEVEAPRRLVMRTHFLFAPPFAAAPPHLVTWDVTGGDGGAHVRMSWEADKVVADLLESQGDAMLQGLRLAADPAARAELERLHEIGEVEIRDVTPELLSEYQRFFDEYAFRDYPAWQDCYCMETHRTQSDEESSVRTAAENRRDMSALIQGGNVTALLAFADGKPVGWLNYGESTRVAGVMKRFGLDAAEHEGVGSLACFVIAAPYREHGIATRLLDRALQRMRARGLPAAEAYPAETDDTPQSNYRGPMQMFMRAGFEPYREAGKHRILRKTLT